jgi:hypothetical protein
MKWHLLINGFRPVWAPQDDKGGGGGDDKQGDDGAGDDVDKGGDDKGSGLGDKLKGSLLERGGDDKSDDKSDKKLDPPAEDKGGADGRPAGVPEKFWDTKTKTVKAADLAQAYSALEKSHGTLKRSKGLGDDVPATAEEYFKDGLELDKDVDRLTIEGPDDPGLKAWGEIALKYGIGKAAAINIAKDMFKTMNGHAPAPIDPEQERAELGPNYKAVTDGVFTWIEGLDRAGKLNDADADVVLGLARTAKGIKFLNKMRGLSGERPIPLDPPSGIVTDMSVEEWREAHGAAVKAKDYKEQERLDKIGETLFGTEASQGSPLRGLSERR